MKQYTVNEQRVVINASDNSLTSTIDTTNLVSLFLNDVLLAKDEDYTVNDSSIVFTNNLSENDNIILNYEIKTNNALITPGKSTKNSVYSRYDSKNHLNENNKYHIGIAIDKDIYEWEFSSRRNPMFCTVKNIRQDIGEFINGFSDEYISDKIYENSLEVINLIDTLKTQDIENVTYTQDDDGFYTSTYSAVSRWVRYKTDIDLVTSRYFGISGNYGSQLKEIGDIKIEKNVKLPYIDNLLKLLKRNFDAADEEIRGVNSVKSAVKGYVNYKYDSWNRTTTW